MKSLAALMFSVFCMIVNAQEVVQFPYKELDGSLKQVEGVLRLPKNDGSKKALIIIHHGGGWNAGTTQQYAEYFEKNGYVTLEPKMFLTKSENPQKHLAQVFGAINYLANRADVNAGEISLMGMSSGGSMALFAATSWAASQYTDNKIKLKSVAAFYPLCFFHKGHAQGEERMVKHLARSGFPEDLYSKWTQIPIKIYIGGKDDYESRDADSCKSFVEAIKDDVQKQMIKVALYPNATHGWDHGRTYTFHDPFACKWQGCRNTNQSDADLTEKVKADLLEFLNMK